MPTNYEPVIGLEVHAELLTESKMFCSCVVVDSTQADPNTAVCEVCSGMPGVLPVVNRQAVEYAMMVGLALNCEIAPENQFARKSYFYPDLPKGYQISQYEKPLAINGWLEVEVDEETQRVGVTRAHLEEDTGKLEHVDGHSLVDLNRAGVPLLEIVSEPDIFSVEALEAYARKLRAILVYLGVNHGDMSKGVLRFEANISVRPEGSKDLPNYRAEIKNLNSIRSLREGTRAEIARQVAILEQGETPAQVTLGWNEAKGELIIQRSKEQAHDYRYFPEPDLPPLVISREWVEEVRAGLPELPDAKRERLMANFGLSRYDADVLVADKAIAAYYEEAVEAGGDPKTLANWITGELFSLMNAADPPVSIDEVKVTPATLVELTGLVAAGTINNNVAKKVLDEVFKTGKPVMELTKGREQISDAEALSEIVAQIMADNPEQVQAYLGGKETVAKWLMGQVMQATRGHANAQVVQELLAERLAGLKEQQDTS
jgi:aspartyl-tRNA(Asn)/glutamyl-tRNA(Gln) amidotransferase subunit B